MSRIRTDCYNVNEFIESLHFANLLNMTVSKKQIVMLRNGLMVRAPAKINLGLLIAGKRPDGFHSIETVMAKINWYDEILIQPGRKPGIQLVCKGPCWAPDGEENLVYQACKSLLAECGVSADIKLTLTKNIPAGTGLGSASSDAAATLIGLNRFLKLLVGEKKLAKIAAALGSDVAFFLDGPLAFCTGKGEKIKKLSKIFDFSALLVIPDVNSSTKRVYAHYRHDSALYEKLHTQTKVYIRKNRIDLVAKMCANMLQKSCFDLYNEIADFKNKVESAVGPVCLSGSGSAMFYIFYGRNKEKARQYKRKLEGKVCCRSVIVSNNRW